MEDYPRLHKAQRMLDLLEQKLKEAERQGDPSLRVLVVKGGPEVSVHLLGVPTVVLAKELGYGGAETVRLFRWLEEEDYIRPNYGRTGRNTETPTAVLENLTSKGYVEIGEVPDPQERLALILEAATRAVERDEGLNEQEKKRRIDWFEEAKFVVRTFGVEVAKAVWRGNLPPM